MQILRKPLLQIVYRVAASYHRAVIQPVSDAAYHSTRIVVVGAGAFGGWTALELRRRGVAVTLVDAWGPGNARASSGGETRIIRATYGQRAIYTRMTLRALELWRDFDRRRELLRETGVLWMFGEDDSFGHESAAVLAAHGASLDPLSLTEAAARYRQVSFDGVRSVFFERDAGYLFARRACELVVSFSHCVAKAARPPRGVPHVCYCFTPMRYAWHMRDAYFEGARFGRLKARLADVLLARLREWDRATADRACTDRDGCLTLEGNVRVSNSKEQVEVECGKVKLKLHEEKILKTGVISCPGLVP